MGEEVAFENGRISDFQGLVTLTLTLDRVILHTACINRRPLPTYQISLKSKKLFVDRQMDVRMDGHLRLTLLGRLGGVDLINQGVCILDLSLLLIIYTCIFTQIANVDVSFSSCLFLFLMYSCLCCFVSSGDQF